MVFGCSSQIIAGQVVFAKPLLRLLFLDFALGQPIQALNVSMLNPSNASVELARLTEDCRDGWGHENQTTVLCRTGGGLPCP